MDLEGRPLPFKLRCVEGRWFIPTEDFSRPYIFRIIASEGECLRQDYTSETFRGGWMRGEETS